MTLPVLSGYQTQGSCPPHGQPSAAWSSSSSVSSPPLFPPTDSSFPPSHPCSYPPTGSCSAQLSAPAENIRKLLESKLKRLSCTSVFFSCACVLVVLLFASCLLLVCAVLFFCFCVFLCNCFCISCLFWRLGKSWIFVPFSRNSRG